MGKAKALLFFSILSIASTVILWLPFILGLREFWGIAIPQQGFATIAANFDGPYYLVAAKSLYDPGFIENNYSFPLSPTYYSAHYPFYPLLIKAVATVPGINHIYAMILITVAASALTLWVFYLFLKDIGLKKEAFWLASLFAIFPARWLIVRSIGSPEPLFLLLIISSIVFFRKQNYWAAGLLGAGAQLTKPPGILLFAAFCLALVIPNWNKLAHMDLPKWIRELPWRAYPILLIPASLFSLFIFYGQKYGSFFAYFNSGDNLHLFFPPFQIFNPAQPWVGTFWLEEIIWIYLIGALGVALLIKQGRLALASFVGIFLLSIFFVSHRDVARYSLPVVPFLFIAFHKLLSSTTFKWIALLLILPIYLFSIAFIANNTTPISDWGPLL